MNTEVFVVGVDGSPASHRALQWTTPRALESQGRVVAVHVLTYSHELAADLPPSGMTNWRRDLLHDLDGPWTEPARAAGVNVRTLAVEDESVAAGLVAAADQEHADLIVLAADGHGNLADRLLGSTTYKVTHRATVPVMIIPPDWRPLQRETPISA